MEDRPIPDTLAKAFSQPSSAFSIDVECVATANDHNSRDVAQISLVVCSVYHFAIRQAPCTSVRGIFVGFCRLVDSVVVHAGL